MASINIRKETGTLYFDFRYKGVRCKELTKLRDTPANRAKMQRVLDRIEKEILTGVFQYRKFFPDSPRAKRFDQLDTEASQRLEQIGIDGSKVPKTETLEGFMWQWYEENEVRWKQSYKGNVKSILTHYLIPTFGKMRVEDIDKSDILRFRSELAKDRNGKKALSPDRVNHIMTPLRMILEDASDRFNFTSPWRGIKPLKVPRSDISPFSLKEVQRILKYAPEEYRDYLTVRFFSGMRTGEIDGLQWKYVDFEKRLILVRESIVNGQPSDLKSASSYRDIQMNSVVYEALLRQKESTGRYKYVFLNRNGKCLDHRNFSKRIWHPLLEQLRLKKRNAYQTRHTAATLWLAAGESPEWIARQMGHSTTEMLFKVYSRYVPNFTRQDGSAVEKILAQLEL